jgi:hypothetical protein
MADEAKFSVLFASIGNDSPGYIAEATRLG